METRFSPIRKSIRGGVCRHRYYYLNNGYLDEAMDWFRKAAVANPDRQRFWNLRIEDILRKRDQVYELKNNLNKEKIEDP
ncbi:hypothetical protein IQB76_12480 [Leptospira borgpetersenii serovar Hardjo-bovis]|uniref:Tetratricopeptide repeat protein n=1 Tax=Leptospira borgpetersenii serovar Hardjo-bovis str. Sponselee TaxID=1303729 RepID=M6BJE2_LEPBO|nr:hypothetical protein LEP1GSC016_2767 [Leptospira borgpetersenii serovar Hardjo-bovis str. Sponselee]MBE8351369.1 hypothetical protein [Leptospira borgpetersenii serovar Hardjo-bovis]MBE8364355.1 hypothetical protein [Leptospira borgpetersenii serovar Balcanica]TQE51995.1 hypothetical protein FFZ95_12190 [Leptospira borgpetersenii]MBE8361782.1 hypothetical protein [Leptospira borgpetersenii serovar Hardjo-bovis]